MTTLALMPHTGKPQAMQVCRALIGRLEALGVSIWLEDEAAKTLGFPHLAGDASDMADLSAAIVLGGDGALLKAARMFAPVGVPLLGVNLGRLGFLTEVELPDLDFAINRLLEGAFTIEERLMLQAEVWRGGAAPEAVFVGLNDAVITRATFARIVRLEARVSGEAIGTFVGDGLIVSTPTGSTAYSLSAGGPILNPQLEALLITPICPHTLGLRPVVARDNEEVEISVHAMGEEVLLTVDGHQGQRLSCGDRVIVRRAPFATRLVKLRGRPFYAVLRSRLSP